MTPQFEGIYTPGSYCKNAGDAQLDPLEIQLFTHNLCKGMLLARTGGEWRVEERNWAVGISNRVYAALGLSKLPAGNGEKYQDFAYRVFQRFLHPLRVHRAITNGRLPRFPYDEWAAEDKTHFDQLEAKAGHTGAEYMRGVPSPRAIKLLSGVLFGYLGAFEARMRESIQRLLRSNPETILQWEMPIELALIAPLPKRLRRLVLKRQIKMIERLIRSTPKGTRHAFHLCWGDLGRRPVVAEALQSNKIKAEVINAIGAMNVWSEGWKLYAIHDPMCDGINPPTGDVRGYDNLAPLPEGTLYALGLLWTNSSATDTVKFARRAAQAIAAASGVSRFALATPCGDGRKLEIEVRKQYSVALSALEELAA